MATITTDLICNLNQPVAATFLHGNLFSQDNAGNTINVHVMDNGEPATIGGTVSANVIRADGNTVAVSGAIDGNKAYVILPQACYAVPGRVEIIIKLTQSTTITTIAAIVANVYRSTTDTVVDPGTIIQSIQALIEEIEDAVDSIPVDYSGLLATIAADYSSSKTYQVGKYAWQGGVLKRCIVPITTAETYTAAHWTNAVIGDDLSALKSALSNADINLMLDGYKKAEMDSSNFEIGTLASNGSTYAATNRIKTKTALYAKYMRAVTIPSSSYKIRFYGYSASAISSSNFIGRTEFETCGSGIIHNVPTNYPYVAYVISKVDDSDVSNTEITYIASNIIRYRISTDDTLTVEQAPADAKVTGTRLDDIIVPISFMENYRIDLQLTTASEPTYTFTYIRCAKVACAEGDKFTVSAKGNATHARTFGFTDSNGTIIDVAPANIELENFVLIAPANAAYLIINDTTKKNSYKGVTLEKTTDLKKRKMKIKTALYLSNEAQETLKKPFLRVSSGIVDYLIDIEPGKSYKVTKAETSARFVVGGVNNLKPTGDANPPVGKIYFRNNNKTVAIFNNGDYKYLLVQVATSSATTMPDVYVEEIETGCVKASIPDFAIPANTATYHQLWSDYIVSNGTKFGKNSVCYRELLTTVHDLPVYAYFISFDTLRMLNGLDYDLEDTVDGEIPFGDYCQFGTKRKVLFISGVHGDEKATPIGLFQWVYNLCYNPEYEKYHCYDYYFIPLVNPTGYNANTRNNADGININRDAVTQSSLEAQAVSGFIASQNVDLFVDFHQAWLPWESTEIPYYAFVSQANETNAEILKKVNQQIFKAGAESDDLINRYLSDSDKPQGSFVWESEPNPETFKNFAIQYSPISCTLETSQRCSYYTGNNSTGYDFTALVCNQTFIDRFLKNMFDLVDCS